MLLLTGSIANEVGQSYLNVADAGLYAILGYAIVFLGLVLLMIVVTIVGKCFSASQARAQKKAAAAPSAEETAEVCQPTAPGTAGQLKLYNVEPKTAAMLMAIVADKLGKPLNELRFISIKEVE